MARIFISYSRADVLFVEDLVPLLQSVYPNHVIWYDQRISGGDDWWQMILGEINACDIFIYLMSNDSLTSRYCQAEFEEAWRLQKPRIPVIIRPKTIIDNAPEYIREEIKRLNWIDLSAGFKDAKANARLYESINRRLASAPQQPPQPLAPQPIAQPPVTITMKRPISPSGRVMMPILIGVVILILVGVIVALVNNNANNAGDDTTPQPTASFTSEGVAQNLTDEPTDDLVATHTTEPTLTPTQTDSPSTTPSPTDTPSITPTETATLDIAEIVGTLDAQATVDQATLNAESTLSQRATDYAVGTQSVIDQTATATFWTDTPTPDITASIVAFRTEQASTATEQYFVGLTETATLWTNTPTPTNTPTFTYTPTNTSTPTHTPSPTPTIPPGYAGGANITANDQWTPIEQEFDGVMMVLVPKGCFMMGSNDYEDEQPVHEQCFDEPFWIDKYEATNKQFADFGGVAGRNSNWTGDNLPRERITWFEARDFCELRGGRLPTEREWEYAARGPNNLIYPWGNEFVADNVVYSSNSNGRTAPVGSRVGGVSWVGAMDMSGNVWEWVSSLYGSNSYPYDEENDESVNYNTNSRVLRGGSWSYSADGVRSANRFRDSPSGENYGGGLRCLRSQ